MFYRTLCALLLSVIASWLVRGSAAAAEIRFDPGMYTSLVEAGSSETIAPGTQITVRNWQQYKRFMPFGMQVLYGGQYHWHVGTGPEYTLTVGPASHVSLSPQFLLDTEKYSSQTRLAGTANGGYALQGYVAGLPFPNPAEPQKAAKILYDARNVYYFALEQSSNRSFLVDGFLNLSRSTSTVVEWRLSHLSTPGKIANPAYGKGLLQAFGYIVKTPVQIKYQTQIALQPDDPSLANENWVFLPSMRRSIRITTIDGCSAWYGDFVFDDQGSFLLMPPANFKVTFLGEHRILHLTHANTDPAVRFNPNSVIFEGSLPGWPKPELGNWELRDVYVIDVTPLPVMGRYCYGHKIFYIDKEGWFPDAVEMYDADGRLWKSFLAVTTMAAGANSEGNLVPSWNNFVLLDLLKNHATMSVTSNASIDDHVSADFQDAAVAAFPGSLANIMK